MKNISKQTYDKIKYLSIRYLQEIEGHDVSVIELAEVFSISRSAIYNWKKADSDEKLGIPSKANFAKLHGIYYSPPPTWILIFKAIIYGREQGLGGSVFSLLEAAKVVEDDGGWAPIVGAILGGAFGGMWGGVLGAAIGAKLSDSETQLGKIKLDDVAIEALKLNPNQSWEKIIEEIEQKNGNEESMADKPISEFQQHGVKTGKCPLCGTMLKRPQKKCHGCSAKIEWYSSGPFIDKD